MQLINTYFRGIWDYSKVKKVSTKYFAQNVTLRLHVKKDIVNIKVTYIAMLRN